jgi:hypothetical protein
MTALKIAQNPHVRNVHAVFRNLLPCSIAARYAINK